jgi:hypothetical protein
MEMRMEIHHESDFAGLFDVYNKSFYLKVVEVG